MEASRPPFVPHEFDDTTIGALAHLYRGEVYRSTLWRTRLDATTNWAVVTLGKARCEADVFPERLTESSR